MAISLRLTSRKTSMRGLCLAGLLLLVPGGFALAAVEQHRYQESTGDQTTQFEWSVEHQAGGIRILASDPGRDFMTVCDSAGATSGWRVQDAERDITAQRSGDRIILRGTRTGRPYAEDITLDGAPWYQAISYSLRAWLAGDAQQAEFWTLRPDTLEAVKLRAERVGMETVDTRAGAVRAVHVRLRANGLLAPFWKADYWFRAEDLVFLKYHAVNGLPGTPPTIIELLPDSRASQDGGEPVGL